MNSQLTNTADVNAKTTLQIREHSHKYYAVLMKDEKTLGVTESFNTQAAANMAGYALLKRYETNVKASLEF